MKNDKTKSKQASKQAKYDMTFVVPVYNAAQYLDECLQSIVASSAEIDAEILCINDGSTDNSLAVLQKWAEKHPEIRIISQENQGVSVARNRGIDEAQGRYIWFVDSDDYLLAENLAGLIDIADAHQVNIVRGLVEFNQQNKTAVYQLVLPTVREKYYRREMYAELSSCVDFLRAAVYLGYMPQICAGFYRTAFLQAYECRFPVGINNAEDEPFAQKVFTAQPEALMFEVSLPLYFYRQNSGSSSHNPVVQLQGSLVAFGLMLAWCDELEQQLMAMPTHDKRWDFRKNSLWSSRFITFRMIASSISLFVEMDEAQLAQTRHLITPAHLQYLKEFNYFSLSSEAGALYNELAAGGFQLAERARLLISSPSR